SSSHPTAKPIIETIIKTPPGNAFIPNPLMAVQEFQISPGCGCAAPRCPSHLVEFRSAKSRQIVPFVDKPVAGVLAIRSFALAKEEVLLIRYDPGRAVRLFH